MVECTGFVKVIYYSAFFVALVGFVMEGHDIKHNIPFTYWLTGALALVTLLKLPFKICVVMKTGHELLGLMELMISLIAYSYLTYMNMEKGKALKMHLIQLNLK